MNKRPFPIVAVSCLFIAAGIVGIAYHAQELSPEAPLEYPVLWALFVRLLAVVGGVFTLCHANWARWLLLGWIVYHVILSGFHSLPQLAVHVVFLAIVLYVFFRPAAAPWFRRAGNRTPQESGGDAGRAD